MRDPLRCVPWGLVPWGFGAGYVPGWFSPTLLRGFGKVRSRGVPVQKGVGPGWLGNSRCREDHHMLSHPRCLRTTCRTVEVISHWELGMGRHSLGCVRSGWVGGRPAGLALRGQEFSVR